jgi:hypothetical protein
MVMRNRHDGAGASGWWDDLPPKVRVRFEARAADDQATAEYRRPAPPVAAPPPAGPSALDWVRELSRVALLFLAVAVANLFFLLVALSFVAPGR